MLTFSWPNTREPSRRLRKLVGISAGLHALFFLILQVVPREKVTAPEREQEIQVLWQDLPAHQALLAAVEAESPLPSLSYRLLAADALLAQPYRSTVSVVAPEAPLEPARWRPPASRPPPVLAALNAKEPATQTSFTPPSPAKGRILLPQSLQQRLIHLPRIPGAPATQTVDAPVFLLGVLPEGIPGHVILQKSSGSEEADRVAESTLRQLTFAPAQAAAQWSEVVLEWSGLQN